MKQKMLSITLLQNQTTVRKFRIIKNLLLMSLSFLLVYTGQEGLAMLQTAMNKKIGSATLSVNFVTRAFTSLLISSFIIKKLGSKNAFLLGIVLVLPFIVSNIYPMWITMLSAAFLKAIGSSLIWTAQGTYFNELSILFCKIGNKRRKRNHSSNLESKFENSDIHQETMIIEPQERKIERLSASDLLKTNNIPVCDRKSAIDSEDASLVTLTSYRYTKDEVSENKLFPKETRTRTIKMDSEDRRKDMSLNTNRTDFKQCTKSTKYRSDVDSTKALFFGINGFAYNSTFLWSSLISYYILETGGKNDYIKTSNSSCGAKFCRPNEDIINNTIDQVSVDTRQLLSGVYVAIGIVALLLVILFLDQMVKTRENVNFSCAHALATIKWMKKKDQLLLIPLSIATGLGRGFYMADFTKSFIACACSISHIGLVTTTYGATSSLSCILSGILIKYVGRKSVMVLCQIIIITNYIFLLFWIPNAQQPYMFYVQGGLFGMISGTLVSQISALYGILFEGDEATAFSSNLLYNSIGWAMPFIYNDFLCVSVKIYIVLALTLAGLIGYLVAERRYSLRNKQTDLSK